MRSRLSILVLPIALVACSGEPTPGQTNQSECAAYYIAGTRNEADVRLVDMMCTQYSRSPGLGDHDLANCLKPNIGSVKNRAHFEAIVRACS